MKNEVEYILGRLVEHRTKFYGEKGLDFRARGVNMAIEIVETEAVSSSPCLHATRHGLVVARTDALARRLDCKADGLRFAIDVVDEVIDGKIRK